MRHRILIGTLALILSLGIGALAATALAGPSAEAPRGAVPTVDAPADPAIPRAVTLREGIRLAPLTPVEAPFPRFEAEAVPSRGGIEIPAPPRLAHEPEDPGLEAAGSLREGLAIPALTPVPPVLRAAEVAARC